MTIKGKFAADLIGDGLGIAVCFWLFSLVEKAEARWMFSQAKAIERIIPVVMISTLLGFLYHVMQFQTYADIYQDRVAGKGMQKIALQSFDLRFDQITDISQTKGFLGIETGNSAYLVVTTAGGSYKIVTKPERAKEILEYFRKNKR